MTTPWHKTGIQVAQNDRGANAHHHKQVSLRFETSSLFYGRFSVQKWPIFAIGLSNDGMQLLRSVHIDAYVLKSQHVRVGFFFVGNLSAFMQTSCVGYHLTQPNPYLRFPYTTGCHCKHCRP